MSKHHRNSHYWSGSSQLDTSGERERLNVLSVFRRENTHRWDLHGLSSLLLLNEEENAGKEDVDEENVDGGEDGEELEEEEEEEERGTDEGVGLSLQLSESLPL